jgi:hypothetical protein
MLRYRLGIGRSSGLASTALGQGKNWMKEAGWKISRVPVWAAAGPWRVCVRQRSNLELKEGGLGPALFTHCAVGLSITLRVWRRRNSLKIFEHCHIAGRVA